MADFIRGTGPDAAARRLMPSLETSARGMSVQQKFLELIARNIANAETTRDVDGAPYARQVGRAALDPVTGEASMTVEEDPTPGPLVYDPGHPDANAEGFVAMPNVDVQRELVDLMTARRLYEANASVFTSAKRMMKRALEI